MPRLTGVSAIKRTAVDVTTAYSNRGVAQRPIPMVAHLKDPKLQPGPPKGEVMSANAINSASTSSQQVVQSNQLQQAATAKPPDESKKSNPAQQQPQQQIRQSGPVTNLQGQTTGTSINTTV